MMVYPMLLTLPAVKILLDMRIFLCTAAMSMRTTYMCHKGKVHRRDW